MKFVALHNIYTERSGVCDIVTLLYGKINNRIKIFFIRDLIFMISDFKKKTGKSVVFIFVITYKLNSCYNCLINYYVF